VKIAPGASNIKLVFLPMVTPNKLARVLVLARIYFFLHLKSQKKGETIAFLALLIVITSVTPKI
jgi:heme/copper-type cytochrome/quinol oxidase subunit 4